MSPGYISSPLKIVSSFTFEPKTWNKQILFMLRHESAQEISKWQVSFFLFQLVYVLLTKCTFLIVSD